MHCARVRGFDSRSNSYDGTNSLLVRNWYSQSIVYEWHNGERPNGLLCDHFLTLKNNSIRAPATLYLEPYRYCQACQDPNWGKHLI
jgi:hypothetical protein